MSFNMDDYVDVAERIRIFRDKHPEGSLQSDIKLQFNGDGFLIGVLCKATAHRHPDDPIPGNGHSYLAVPGKTPYTKDSEVENAETSAWGRAIVAALAADTKKIASSDEIKTKHDTASTASPAVAGETVKETANRPPASPQTDGGYVWPSGKHKDEPIENTETSYLEWYRDNGPKPDAKAACVAELARRSGAALDPAFDPDHPDNDVPF